MIQSSLKKIWIRWFTANPYAVKSFKEVYPAKPGKAIENPESLSQVLLTEAGAPIFYRSAPVSATQNIAQQYINGKPRFINTGIFSEPDRHLYSITNGTVWGAGGLVYDVKKRAFIAESANEWTVDLKDSPFTNVVNFPPKTRLAGTTLSCLSNGADAGFYHFLFESMVKIHFAKAIIAQVDHILMNGPKMDWKVKWLERAGVDQSKITWTDNNAHFECEQLLFTNRLVNDQQISAWCVNSLKALLTVSSAPKSSVPKAIWITRKGLSARSIAWEEIILANFPSVEIVDFSSLNVTETIEKMQSATHIIAPHGAGLSNIYLCNEDARVLELFPAKALYKPCFHRLSTVCGLKHQVAWLNFQDGQDTKQGLAFLQTLLTEFLWQD